MSNLLSIKGVRGRMNNDTAELHVEDVSRELGFTQVKNGQEYIRWETITSYLKELGFSQLVGKDSFIPENMFYKLCFKARNNIATAFQDFVTDEVLPSIRKHGTYITSQKIEEILSNPDTIINLANQIKIERAEKTKLQEVIEEQKPKVEFAKALETSKDTVLVRDLSAVLKQNGIDIGQNRLFKQLRSEGYLCKQGESNNMPTQRSLDLGVLEIKISSKLGKYGIARMYKTPKVTAKGLKYFINKFKQVSVTQ